jgi:hypothetical protein
MKEKKFKSFDEYHRSLTDSYPPPKYVIAPQPGDKGFALVKSALDKTEKILEPGLWSEKLKK